jgi:hypothetical protein
MRWPSACLLLAPVDGLSDRWPGEVPAPWTWLAPLAASLVSLPARLLRAVELRRRPLLYYVVLWIVAAGLLLLSVGAFALATHGAQLWQPAQGSAPSGQVGVVLRSQSPTPTLAPPAYAIGAWPSNSSPPSSGTLVIYVRVTETLGDAAAVGVPVYLKVKFPYSTQSYGPVPTNGDGIAAFKVTYGGLPPGQPAFVTASMTIAGRNYTADTVFAGS